MYSRRTFAKLGLALTGGAATGLFARQASATEETAKRFEIMKSEAEWQTVLTPEQYRVLRKHGTERAGTSPLNKTYAPGVYHCAGCDLPLYSSETKFDSGTGWPSFWQPLTNAVGTSGDDSFFMTRTEVHCRRCGGHLGHVFDDGPQPTGMSYCINGVAMKFVPKSASSG